MILVNVIRIIKSWDRIHVTTPKSIEISKFNDHVTRPIKPTIVEISSDVFIKTK